MTAEPKPSIPAPHRPSSSAKPPHVHASSAMAKLAKLAPLTDSLAHSLKCPICLEYMEDARQLQCGHLFCAECVVRILGMRKVRCAICKEKTGKRMVRAAPFAYGDIVRGLRALEAVIDGCNARPAADAKQLTEHQKMLQAALSRARQAQQQRASPARKASGGARTPRVPTPKKAAAPPKDSCCVLCPRSQDPGPDRKKFGRLIPVRLVDDPHMQYVHENCAMFSEEVYPIENQVYNLDRIRARTKHKQCYRHQCTTGHPTLMCAVEDCNVWMHYRCALSEGCELVEDGFKMFCKHHKGEAPKMGGDFETLLAAPSESCNLNHDDACYLCRTGGRLLMCDTCERVTHPVCSGLKGIPIGDWSCGVCTGVHKVPPKPVVPARETSPFPVQATLKRRRTASPSNDDFMDRGLSDSQARPSSQKRPRRSSDGWRRLVLAHTGLKENQSEELTSMLKARRTTVRGDVEEKVNYVVIGVCSPHETPTRTMKLCFAVARKIPILCWSWVEESKLTEDSWAPTERHVHRLTLHPDEPAILGGKKFCFSCFSGEKSKRQQFASLVRLAGGTVVQREGKGEIGDILYVRGDDSAAKRSRGAKSRFEPPPGATVIPSSWILDQLTKERMK